MASRCHFIPLVSVTSGFFFCQDQVGHCRRAWIHFSCQSYHFCLLFISRPHKEINTFLQLQKAHLTCQTKSKTLILKTQTGTVAEKSEGNPKRACLSKMGSTHSVPQASPSRTTPRLLLALDFFQIWFAQVAVEC